MKEAKFKVGDKVVLTEKGKRAVENRFYRDKVYLVKGINGDFYTCIYEEDNTILYMEPDGIKRYACGRKEEQFKQLTQQMLETFKKKNADYGDSTTQTFEEFGLTSYAIRLNDKLNRIKSFCKKGELEVKDEGIVDSLMDMASYCLLAVVDIKNKEYGKED